MVRQGVTEFATQLGSLRNATHPTTAAEAPDQLRQRVAFALNQIFVVSDVSSSVRAKNRSQRVLCFFAGNSAWANIVWSSIVLC